MVQENRGQASTEYAMVALLIGTLMVPAVYFFYSYSQSSAAEIDHAQIDRLGRSIIAAAETAYYQGPPSRTELEARMPQGVINISVRGDWNSGTQALLITARAPGGSLADFEYYSKTNLNGSFNRTLREITTSPGIKKVTIEAYEVPGPGGQATSFTHINFGGRCPRSTIYDYDQNGAINDFEKTHAENCLCNRARSPSSRPSKTWRQGWFNHYSWVGPFGTGSESNEYTVCMNVDYDANCVVDMADWALACTAVGGFFCSPPASC